MREQAQERRLVAVLFADFAGFTQLADQMDPEELQRMIEALEELAAREGMELSDLAKALLRADTGTLERLLREAGARSGVDDIQRVVCHHFKLRTSDLLSKDRHKSIAFARHVAMYLCKQRLKCSFPELGRAFGNRDHTTVMSAVRKVEHLRTTDPEVRAHLEAIERKLGTND